MTAFRRVAGLTVLVLCVAASAQAQSLLARGDVLVQVSEPDASVHMTPSESALLAYRTDGTKKTQLPVALETRSALFAPAPDRLLVSQVSSVAVSNDAATIAARHLAAANVTDLGEIVAMRSGELLVAERNGRSAGHPPRLLRFNASGEVLRVYELELIRRGNYYTWSAGPAHMELLSDQCTLVYTLGFDPDRRRLMRYDVCAGRTMPDLFALPSSYYSGAIRQLPSGDLLIATYGDVRRFGSDGTLRETYPVPAVRLALTADAGGFWAADYWTLHRVDFVRPALIAERIALPLFRGFAPEVRALAVVDEWRAATRFIKRRPVRR